MKLKFNAQSIEWLGLGIPSKTITSLKLMIDEQEHVLTSLCEMDLSAGSHTFKCEVFFTDSTSLVLDEITVDCNFPKNARFAIVFAKKNHRASNAMHSVTNWIKVFASLGTIPFTALASDYYYNKLGDKAFKLIVVKSK